jgi:hypothetical protein
MAPPLATAEDSAPGFRGDQVMSRGQIVVGHVAGRLFIRWFLDREMLRAYLDSDIQPDDVIGISADGLRLEISAHDGEVAAAKAAHDLRDMAALAMQAAKGAA